MQLKHKDELLENVHNQQTVTSHYQQATNEMMEVIRDNIRVCLIAQSFITLKEWLASICPRQKHENNLKEHYQNMERVLDEKLEDVKKIMEALRERSREEVVSSVAHNALFPRFHLIAWSRCTMPFKWVLMRVLDKFELQDVFEAKLLKLTKDYITRSEHEEILASKVAAKDSECSQKLW